MGLESRSSSLSKGSSSSRKRPGVLLLLLALGAALLSVAVLHKLRERRVLGLLVLDQERDLLALHALLQKERERNKRVKSRLEGSRDKIVSLTQQKNELQDKLMEDEAALAELKRLHKETEATLEEKEEQIKQMADKASVSAESTNQQVSLLTQLLKEKDSEIEQMRKQQPNPEDEAAHGREEVISSRNETWVRLETIVEDEGGRSQGNQSAEEEPGKQEGEGREIEELQGTESIDQRAAAEKEEELENSPALLVHEDKMGPDSTDSTAAERPKMVHRRRRGRRTKAKSRRRRESEKQDRQEAADGRTADADDGKEELAGGAANEEGLETTTTIPHESKASESTAEVKADTDKGEGSKREDSPESNPQLPAETGERREDEEEAISAEEKPVDSAASGDGNDDDSEESNDRNHGKDQQEEASNGAI